MIRGGDGYYQFADETRTGSELLDEIQPETRRNRRRSDRKNGVKSDESFRDRGNRKGTSTYSTKNQGKILSNKLLSQQPNMSGKPGDGSMLPILDSGVNISSSYLELSRNLAISDLLVLEDDLSTLNLSFGVPSHAESRSRCADCNALQLEVRNLRQSLRLQRKMDMFVKEYELRFQRFRESVSTGEERLRKRIVQLEHLVGVLVRRLEEEMETYHD